MDLIWFSCDIGNEMMMNFLHLYKNRRRTKKDRTENCPRFQVKGKFICSKILCKPIERRNTFVSRNHLVKLNLNRLFIRFELNKNLNNIVCYSQCKEKETSSGAKICNVIGNMEMGSLISDQSVNDVVNQLTKMRAARFGEMKKNDKTN